MGKGSKRKGVSQSDRKRAVFESQMARSLEGLRLDDKNDGPIVLSPGTGPTGLSAGAITDGPILLSSGPDTGKKVAKSKRKGKMTPVKLLFNVDEDSDLDVVEEIGEFVAGSSLDTGKMTAVSKGKGKMTPVKLLFNVDEDSDLDVVEETGEFVAGSSLDTGKMTAVSKGKGKMTASQTLDDIGSGFTFRVDENERRTKPSDRYIGIQCDINEEKRSTLIDFIVSLHVKLELSPEILYLTVKLIDYSLLRHPLPASDLHHLGVGALLTAWKDLDAETVDVDYLMSVTNSFSSINICSKKKILKMEKTSLQELANNLGNETQYEYLLKFIKASRSNREVKNMVHYLVELGMVHLDTTLFHPSLWAASAIYTVRCCLDKSPPWTDALESLTKYSENQLMECSKLLFSKHSEASGGSNLRAVFKKYSRP